MRLARRLQQGGDRHAQICWRCWRRCRRPPPLRSPASSAGCGIVVLRYSLSWLILGGAGTKIGAKGGKFWVVADCSVESIVVVVAWSLSGPGGLCSPPLGVSERDSWEF